MDDMSVGWLLCWLLACLRGELTFTRVSLSRTLGFGWVDVMNSIDATSVPRELKQRCLDLLLENEFGGEISK